MGSNEEEAVLLGSAEGRRRGVLPLAGEGSARERMVEGTSVDPVIWQRWMTTIGVAVGLRWIERSVQPRGGTDDGVRGFAGVVDDNGKDGSVEEDRREREGVGRAVKGRALPAGGRTVVVGRWSWKRSIDGINSAEMGRLIGSWQRREGSGLMAMDFWHSYGLGRGPAAEILTDGPRGRSFGRRLKVLGGRRSGGEGRLGDDDEQGARGLTGGFGQGKKNQSEERGRKGEEGGRTSEKTG